MQHLHNNTYYIFTFYVIWTRILLILRLLRINLCYVLARYSLTDLEKWLTLNIFYKI